MARRASFTSRSRIDFGDPSVLFLDAPEVVVLLRRGCKRRADAVARDNMLAQEGEELRELRVESGIRDRPVESEILPYPAVAAGDRRFHLPKRLCDRGQMSALGALGGKRRRFHFDGDAQLHDVEHIADRAQAIGVDAECAASAIGCYEGARSLPGSDQAFRTQGSHRLPYDGAADAHPEHQLLFGRQSRTGLEPAAADFMGYPCHYLFGKIARRAQGPEQSLLVSGPRRD